MINAIKKDGTKLKIGQVVNIAAVINGFENDILPIHALDGERYSIATNSMAKLYIPSAQEYISIPIEDIH
jgi:hypothetical protein